MDILLYMIHKFLWRIKSIFGYFLHKEIRDLDKVSK